MTARTVVVALVVVLAGCQFTVGADGGSTPTPTATPAPVPTDDPSLEQTARPEFPPGVSRDGVTEVSLLARTHVRAVVGRSYVWADRLRTDPGDDSPAQTLRREVRLVNGTYYNLTLPPEGLADFSDYRLGIDRYADGTYRYSRLNVNGEEVDWYTISLVSNASSQVAVRSAGSIRRYLALPDASVSVRVVDGERRYAITAYRDVYERIDAYNYTARAVVSPDGLVRWMNVSYVTAPDGSGTTVTYAYEYREFGITTVRPPAWVDEARAQYQENDTITGPTFVG